MERSTLNELASALQAIFEALGEVSRELPPERREKLAPQLKRVLQAKAAIMLELT